MFLLNGQAFVTDRDGVHAGGVPVAVAVVLVHATVAAGPHIDDALPIPTL